MLIDDLFEKIAEQKINECIDFSQKFANELIDLIQQDWFVMVLYKYINCGMDFGYPAVVNLFRSGKMNKEDYPCFYHMTMENDPMYRDFLRPNLKILNKIINPYGIAVYSDSNDYRSYSICRKMSKFERLCCGYRE